MTQVRMQHVQRPRGEKDDRAFEGLKGFWRRRRHGAGLTPTHLGPKGANEGPRMSYA